MDHRTEMNKEELIKFLSFFDELVEASEEFLKAVKRPLYIMAIDRTRVDTASARLKSALKNISYYK